MNRALLKAIKICGSQSALARKLSITPQQIGKWLRAGHIPAERVIQIELALNHEVTRYQLRPDIYPKD